MRFLAPSLMVLFVALQFTLWFGDKGMVDLYQLKTASARTQAENAAIQERNEKLVAEVIDLKKGGPTVETIARTRYGLIKENETFYQIVE